MDIVTYALLNGKIKDYANNVDEWLEENVDPATGYVLDRSLQMENAAAPADMVGDINDEVGDLKNTLNHMENGVNENMTAGNAMQLDSNLYAEDKEPYLFRQTGGSVEAGNREEDCIIGATVGWNQIVSDANISKSATLSNITARNANIIAMNAVVGHKYLIRVGRVTITSENDAIDYYLQIGFNYTPYHTATLLSNANGASILFAVSTSDNSAVGNAVVDYEGLNIYDLTKMFGPTIADRAYALEQATAGSGIAWLKSMGFFTKDYYAYDAGSLQSVKVGSHKTYDADNNVIGNYPLDTTKEWRGILKLDANNKVYADGDIYPPSGEAQRRYGIVDLGTLDWTYNSSAATNPFFYASYSDIKRAVSQNDKANIICTHYMVNTWNACIWEASNDDCIAVDSTRNVIGIVDKSYTDAATFKTALQNGNVKLVYELATPTSESAMPYQKPQICAADGTEEYTDYAVAAGTRDVAVPVGHDTKYPPDQVKKLDNLPSDLSFVGPIENGATCQNANGYLQGQYFVKNNQFCKAKTAIASGATFTLNTNYEVTTVAAELYAAINS